MIKKIKPKIYVFITATLGACVLFGCAAALLFVQFYRMDGPTPQEGQERAGKLLIALEQYKNETGSYPADLNLLIPNYLPSLPRPGWRWPYAYEYEVRQNGKGFVIFFEPQKDPDDYCGYSSETTEWRCTDSMPPY